MTDLREFTHPNLGKAVTISQSGEIVALAFTCRTQAKADALFEAILDQLKAGSLSLTMLAPGPGRVEEDDDQEEPGRAE